MNRRILPLPWLAWVCCLVLALASTRAQDATPEGTLWYTKHTHTHDHTAFTQGLLYDDDSGNFYESTGLYGQSTLRFTTIEGTVLTKVDLENSYFGEGLSEHPTDSNLLYQLTWKELDVLVWRKDTMTLVRKYQLLPRQQGWGLTEDGNVFYLTNGTEYLSIRDATSFEELRSVKVTYQGKGVRMLNEVEYFKGHVWANIWQTNQIVVINPQTGVVSHVMDMSSLVRDERLSRSGGDVLNGIAYDEKNDRIWVTGKKWSRLYEIGLRGGLESISDPATTPVQSSPSPAVKPSQSVIITPDATHLSPSPTATASHVVTATQGIYLIVLSLCVIAFAVAPRHM